MQISALVVLLVLGAARAQLAHVSHAPMLEMYKWKYIDFAYPDESAKVRDIKSGHYVRDHVVPYGIAKWGSKIFVATPRWNSGVPVTLSYLQTNISSYDSPKLIPYPSWHANQAHCRLTSVARIIVDPYDRLWVLDDGQHFENANLTKTMRSCPANLQIYDLKTDKLLMRYEFPRDQFKNGSLFMEMAVDIGPKGYEDAWAYVIDPFHSGLIAYSLAANDSRLYNQTFFRTIPNIGARGLGLFSMALSPLNPTGYRTLYFDLRNKLGPFGISTQYFRNALTPKEPFIHYEISSFGQPNYRSSAFNDSTLLFTPLPDSNAVICWNSRLAFRPSNIGIVAKQDKVMQFPSDVEVNNGTLWILSNRFTNILDHGFNETIYNFRIFSIPVENATTGTVCDRRFQSYPLSAASTPSPYSSIAALAALLYSPLSPLSPKQPSPLPPSAAIPQPPTPFFPATPQAYSPETYAPGAQAYQAITQAYQAYQPISKAYSSIANAYETLAQSYAPPTPYQPSPAQYSPKAYQPQVYQPQGYQPQAYQPQTYSPFNQAYQPYAYSPFAQAFQSPLSAAFAPMSPAYQPHQSVVVAPVPVPIPVVKNEEYIFLKKNATQ